MTFAALQNGFAILRLRTFPAWRILVNGLPVVNLPRRADGLVAVPIAAGHVTLTADWTTTPDVKIGRAITALALILLTILWLAERRPDFAISE